MQRYNQGFGKFGPMEKAAEGEWVRFTDALSMAAHVRHQKDAICESMQKREEQLKEQLKQRTQYQTDMHAYLTKTVADLTMENHFLKKALVALSVSAIVAVGLYFWPY